MIRNGADILMTAALVSLASSASSAAARYPDLLRNATHRCRERRVELELGTCDASYNGYHFVAMESTVESVFGYDPCQSLVGCRGHPDYVIYYCIETKPFLTYFYEFYKPRNMSVRYPYERVPFAR